MRQGHIIMTDISTATCFVICWFSLTNRFHVAVRLFSNRDQSPFKSEEGGGGENIFDGKKNFQSPTRCHGILYSSLLY